jgi:hypothetical protein
MSNEMQSLRAISLGLFAAMVMLIAAPLRAEEQADTSFAKRFFAGNAGQPKAYACFTRRIWRSIHSRRLP